MSAASPHADWIVMGGGLCGLAAARYLRHGWQLFEAADRPGGLARSVSRQGHVFDHTGHWLHLRDRGMKQLVRRLLGDELMSLERRSRIFSHGVLTRYPFQANLHGLPPKVVLECLQTFLDREPPHRPGRRVRTFEDFILTHFGTGIARHFMIPYNARLWGVHPREMTDAWCRRFVPIPSRNEVLAGAVGAPPSELGYNVRFLYPRAGGMERLPRALAAELPPERIHCNAPVERVDHRGHRVRVGGEWIGYRALVSTLPLPVLCELLVAPPKPVEHAARRLRWTAVRYLNVALKRRPPADFHWIYVPEARYPAYRVGVFSNAAPGNAPARGASLYVELASRGGERLDTLLGQVVPLLLESGAMRRAEDLRYATLERIEHAYVIFDRHYALARRTLLSFFADHDIYSCGRYGSWDYGSMEDALLEGRAVAKLLRKRYKRIPDERPAS
jgi:protoporphyrinogen oxidase